MQLHSIPVISPSFWLSPAVTAHATGNPYTVFVLPNCDAFITPRGPLEPSITAAEFVRCGKQRVVMAPAIINDASAPGARPHPTLPPETGDELQLDSGALQTMSPAKRQKDPAVCPTDEEAKFPRTESQQRNKRSFDYLWRSGVAGGFAGCAVRYPSSSKIPHTPTESAH